MINSYYIMEGGAKTGPFTFQELIERPLDTDVLVLSPLDQRWQHAGNIAEFNNYYRSRDIYYPTPYNGANIFRRLLARTIDIVFVVVVCFVLILAVMVVLNLTTTIRVTSKENHEMLGLAYIGSTVGMLFLYVVLLECSRLQATIGKSILGLAVVGPTGKRITLLRSSLRNLSRIASGLPLGIGYLMILWTHKPQMLHDRIADCFVIRKKK